MVSVIEEFVILRYFDFNLDSYMRLVVMVLDDIGLRGLRWERERRYKNNFFVCSNFERRKFNLFVNEFRL